MAFRWCSLSIWHISLVHRRSFIISETWVNSIRERIKWISHRRSYRRYKIKISKLVSWIWKMVSLSIWYCIRQNCIGIKTNIFGKYSLSAIALLHNRKTNYGSSYSAMMKLGRIRWELVCFLWNIVGDVLWLLVL